MPSRGIARLHSTSLPSMLCGLDPRHSSRDAASANVTKPKPRDLQCQSSSKFKKKNKFKLGSVTREICIPITHTVGNLYTVGWPAGASEDGDVQQQQRAILVSPVYSEQTKSKGGWG